MRPCLFCLQQPYQLLSLLSYEYSYSTHMYRVDMQSHRLRRNIRMGHLSMTYLDVRM